SANAVDEYAVTDGDGTLIGSTAVITNALGLTGAYEGVSVDLTGTACEFISGATEFRIYAWGRGTNATENTRAAIDKVVLFGNESNDSGRNSYFWMTLKPQAGTETGADTDLELANGYRKVDLSSPDLSCTRVDSGSNWVYQITWAGNNLVGGDDAETLQFNVVVDAFSGADYTYVADDAVVTSLGDASALTDVDNYWGVDGDSDLDAGESIRMTQQDVTMNGADLASNGLVLVERAFTNMKVLETNGGNSHKIIFGVGTNLATASFSAPTESYDVSGESFSVTGAGSNVGSRQWAISEVSFRLVVRNPALTEEDPDYPFSDIAEGHAYGPTPYEPTTSNKLAQAFPRFSWDIIPRTMLVRKGSNSFTDDEAERMANRYDFVVLEKANGSIEGYHDKASALKAFNPDIKVVFYWNSRIYYGHYGVDDSINDHWDEYIDPDFMIRGWPTYQRSNPDFIDWWVGVGHKMMGLVAGYATDGTTSFIPSPIDGYFIDKTGVPASMLQPLYEGSPDHKFCMNNNGDNRTRLPYLDGTYREGWTGGGNPTAIATAIALAQESGRNGKLTMLRNPYSGSSPRDMEDGVDFSLGIYLTYADEYAYFYHQASVDATDAGWQWLTDYYDQFQRPLGQPLGDAVREGWIYTRSFERCDVFLELETDSGGKQSRILWKNDIGSPALAGSGASRTDDTYTLQGCGTLSGSSDQFFYLSDLHYGNGTISACIDHLDAAHADARAGVMFRERTEPTALDYTDTEYVDACVAAYSNGTVLAAGARTVAVLRDSAGQMNMVYRSATNGVLQTAGTLGPAFGPYAKLVRSGDTFTGYSSADGLSWTTIAQVTLPLAEKIEMGMAVTSGENTALAEAMFSGFERIESAPTAAAQSVTTDEDTAVAITLSGSDGVGSTNFIYTVISPPAHGTLSGTAPNLTYTPETNFFGADAFSFSVNDGFAESEEAAVSITVEPMDDAPVAHDLLVGTTKDLPVNITLAGTDPDGSNLTYRVVSLPTNGTLSGTAPDLLYTPAQLGSDHFTFDVDDGSATSGVATVTIDVTPFIYRDFFDGDGLDVNTAGVGGGAANTTLNSPASWSDDGDATYSAGGNYQDAALLYSTNAFQSTGGFELTVYYTCNNVATSGRNLFGFGLLEDAGSFSQNSSPFAEVASVYSIGVNLITESGVPRGLNFTDGSTVTALDGATFTAGAATPVVIRIEADGIGGADWSYSIDGTMEAAGHLDRFDFSRSFHFAAYGQDNERTKIIHSVELERLPEPGRYAVWAAGFGLEDEGALAGADADGDGYENLTEYALGMNPTNSDAGSRDWNNIWTEGGTNWFEYIHY
ncbi:Ig-like domain-containing protein, partial [Pontiella sp.]|uniref:Ig-like domain-containing protein n=1 Tax=Pontiella sp. TaxID=2837462 RepID=UPI003563B9D5